MSQNRFFDGDFCQSKFMTCVYVFHFILFGRGNVTAKSQYEDVKIKIC